MLSPVGTGDSCHRRGYFARSDCNVVGPLLIGTPAERGCYRAHGVKPEGTHFVDALGSTKIADLTTGDIGGIGCS